MPQHTVTAFRWTGTYYNATYNTSHTAVFDDDDDFLDGQADSSETVSIDGGGFNATGGQPYDIDVSFTDVNGDSHVETFHFFYSAGSWYFIPEPGSEFTEGATLGTYQSHTTEPTPYDMVTCFVRGTMIETDTGPMAVEALKSGDMIVTADGRLSVLRVAMRRTVAAAEVAQNPTLAPVRIRAGALGNGMPYRDLLVSRQHRMLVTSTICERMFGTSEALVAAVKLTGLPGIDVVEDAAEVEYFHLVFKTHEVVFAEGAPSESFYPGPEALKTLSPAAKREIVTLFPELGRKENGVAPARFIPSSRHQKEFVQRHQKNNRPVLCA